MSPWAPLSDSSSVVAGSAGFGPTRWSIVLAAGRSESTHARGALEQLCRAYWYPLYAFVRRQGYSPADAQDLTREFIARLIEKRYLDSVDQATCVPSPRFLSVFPAFLRVLRAIASLRS